ncbi:TPA: hypothetical protein ACH3X1_008127 [Trebouxia sp. C0004]
MRYHCQRYKLTYHESFIRAWASDLTQSICNCLCQQEIVLCVCALDGVNHYRLFVVAVHASLAQLCVWDPLDLQARKASDSQAALALSVMQKLLPKHKVQASKPTSMRVLNASHIFATEQTDGYQCGPIAVRALVHLLFQTEFDLGERSLNNVRIWMAP